MEENDEVVPDERSLPVLSPHLHLFETVLFTQLSRWHRDIAQNNEHQKIEVSDIREALPQYSQWKLRDLRDEYQVEYPFLEKVFLTIFYSTTSRLSHNEIVKSFEPVKDNLIKEFGVYFFHPLANLLQVLYNIGFLGMVSEDKVFYSFLGDKVIITYASQFEIHPAFRSALSISSSSSQNIVAGERQIVGVTQSISEIGSGGTITGVSIDKIG